MQRTPPAQRVHTKLKERTADVGQFPLEDSCKKRFIKPTLDKQAVNNDNAFKVPNTKSRAQ
jgi:hypothetical protein